MTSHSHSPSSPPQLNHVQSNSHSTDTVVNNKAGGVDREVIAEAPNSAEGEKADPFEVKWEENDPDNPKNWSRAYRWYLTSAAGLLVLNATFASSSPEGIVPTLETKFGFGSEIASLLISLFVAGYCVGPLLWGPASEVFGRRPVFLVSFLFYTGFQVGCALSKNTASILIFRFLGGLFAAAPLANSGALIADIWDADTRGRALAFFVLAPFAGPALGPVAGGYMAVAGVSWHWTFWLLTFFAGACLAVIFFTIPETYTPALLVKRAKKLRKETGDDRWWAPLERNTMAIGERVKHVLGRPFVVLSQEPMLIAITAYMSFVYGCLYLLFEAFPIVFTEGHHMNEGVSGLMFIPLFIGGVTGVILYILIFDPRYRQFIVMYAPHPVPPERRLEMALWGAPAFAISFFWFGWTSYPSISYWAPMMASLPIGWSIVWIFLGLINYTIDAYLFVSASALSGQTVVRSLFGAGFPLFATQMYDALNPRWASTLLGFVALALGPIPFVLIKFGPTLRKKSKYAPTLPHEIAAIRAEEDDEAK